MASPQKENGYTAISNELLDALCRVRIPGESRQVLDVIIRKTYGFNKKYDCISNSQFVKYTGIKKQHVSRAITKLKNMNIIYTKSVIGSDKVIHNLSTIKDKKELKSVTNMGTNSNLINKLSDSKQKDSKVINNLKSVTNKGTKGTHKGTWKTASYCINKDYESWLSIIKRSKKIYSNQYGVQKGKKCNQYGGTQKTVDKDNIYIDDSSNEKEIKEYFINVFKKKYGRPYRFLLKETNKIKELLKVHDKYVVLDLIDLFFEEAETNTWLKDRCNFSMFNHKVNDLVIKLSSLSNK